MTKHDGDRLRAMQDDLREMVSGYGRDSTTGDAAMRLVGAIGFALRGVAFDVRPLEPSSGRLIEMHPGEAFAPYGTDPLNPRRTASA